MSILDANLTNNMTKFCAALESTNQPKKLTKQQMYGPLIGTGAA